MTDFKLTISSLGFLVSSLTKLITSNQNLAYRVTIKQFREKRSISQNSFQHSIYNEISVYLIGKKRLDWTPEFVKRNLKNKFLGWEEIELIDIETGEVSTRSVMIETSKLDVGESCDYTTRILDWAQSIGCNIKIPSKCDYRDYLEKQDN